MRACGQPLLVHACLSVVVCWCLAWTGPSTTTPSSRASTPHSPRSSARPAPRSRPSPRDSGACREPADPVCHPRRAALFLSQDRAGYCGSKFALHGFLESLRLELGPKYGTEITVICPGVVATDINRTRLGAAGTADADTDGAAFSIDMKRKVRSVACGVHAVVCSVRSAEGAQRSTCLR